MDRLRNMVSGTGYPATLLILETGTIGPDLEDSDVEGGDLIADFNLATRFAKKAMQQPHATAISTVLSSWSYRELLVAAIQIAAFLKEIPTFSPGARVVLLLNNSAEYLAAFYGTLLADGVVVPLAPNTESRSLRLIFESTEAQAAIVGAEIKSRHEFLKELPLQKVPLQRSTKQSHVVSLKEPLGNGNDLAAIFFTAGSTGDPKGVMLSHRNLLENACSIQKYLEINAAERPLCVLPFYHAFGNSVLQSHLLAGATLILDGSTLFPETIIGAIAKHRVTSLSAVPDLIRMLLERTSIGTTPLPSLRYVAVAGGSLNRDLANSLVSRIAPAKLFSMYGQTEATARLAYVPPDHLLNLPSGCIGRPIPGVELEVVDERGCRVTNGETGELRARGANIMLGYWRDAESTAELIRDGWLSTGDLAMTDERGWFYHRGRRNAIVKIAGFRVHPAELEDFAICRLLATQAVAVPFESHQVGTRLALFVCQPSQDALTIEEMLKRCHSELPRQLVPHIIRVLTDFPLNSALKIDRILLSKTAEEDHRGCVKI